MEMVIASTTTNNKTIDSIKTAEKIPTTNSTNNSQKDSNNIDKRKKKKGNAQNHNFYSQYESITFTKRQSSGRPGSPHRFFASSFNADLKQESPSSISMQPPPSPVIVDSIEETNHKTDTVLNTTPDLDSSLTQQKSYSGCQVVHKHANGLCVVTAGDAIRSIVEPQIDDEDTRPLEGRTIVEPTIVKVAFQTQETDVSSVGGKRKKAKMMRGNGKKNCAGTGVVKASDVIAVVTLGDGREVPLRACVSGTIIELNRRLTVESVEEKTGEDAAEYRVNSNCSTSSSMLVTDPLLDGYLAVIMPNGQFPPPANIVSKKDRVAT